ncbi:hypothetical protein NN561_019393 [Cricetulus griseus]
MNKGLPDEHMDKKLGLSRLGFLRKKCQHPGILLWLLVLTGLLQVAGPQIQVSTCGSPKLRPAQTPQLAPAHLPASQSEASFLLRPLTLRPGLLGIQTGSAPAPASVPVPARLVSASPASPAAPQPASLKFPRGGSTRLRLEPRTFRWVFGPSRSRRRSSSPVCTRKAAGTSPPFEVFVLFPFNMLGLIGLVDSPSLDEGGRFLFPLRRITSG